MSEVEQLMTLKKKMQPYFPLVDSSWQAVLDNEVSKYPVLVFSPMPIDMGVLLIEREQAPGPWSTYMSSLEEFHVKKLVDEQKVQDFIDVYKDPSEQYCTFVISDLGAQFIFVPKEIK